MRRRRKERTPCVPAARSRMRLIIQAKPINACPRALVQAVFFAPASASSANPASARVRGAAEQTCSGITASDDITALERIIDALVIAFSDHFDLCVPNFPPPPTRSAQAGVKKVAGRTVAVAQPSERPNEQFTRGPGGDGPASSKRARAGATTDFSSSSASCKAFPRPVDAQGHAPESGAELARRETPRTGQRRLPADGQPPQRRAVRAGTTKGPASMSRRAPTRTPRTASPAARGAQAPAHRSCDSAPGARRPARRPPSPHQGHPSPPSRARLPAGTRSSSEQQRKGLKFWAVLVARLRPSQGA